MTLYKHYSFDLWMTLIRSNPSFKKERAAFFYSKFNGAKKTIQEIELIFRQVDLMCNAINEKTGKNIDSDEMYMMVIYQMNEGQDHFPDIDLTWLYAEMERLVMKYMPVAYGIETAETLNKIKDRGDATISLLSNTAFIKGITLRKVLKEIELDGFFDFQLYSDESGMSKPNSRFFLQMVDQAGQYRKEDKIELHEIIHVGDNKNADIIGAEAIGINSLLVNSNENTISRLVQS
jgi:putative hydrolase of the HAD superfamily